MKKISKLIVACALSLAIALLSVPVTFAADANGSCGDNVTWTFNSSTSELRIEGSGDMDTFDYVDDSMKTDSPWSDLLSSIKAVTIAEGITGISRGSFSQAINLTEVVLPSTLERISEAAFYGCSSLKEITIPNGISEIGYYAFQNCTSLESIIIPDSVTRIGESAFKACSALKNIDFPEHSIDFHQDIFCDCSSLKSITIPEGCTYINARMFRGCKALENISIPASVTSMYLSSFWSCNNLKNIYYSGSEADWNNIEIIDADTQNFPSFSEGFKNATIHYNSDFDAGALSNNGGSYADANTDDSTADGEKDDNTLTIILIASGVVLAALAGVAIALIIKKKK